ncbi:FAD:protein FMN transferase [Neobacillus niacini]|uniref:FAD:protein FMN transferase n=1 Tax=Neobacillus niacini TaxID=86668 RepID=UPI0028601434|nr:FAD:protein FMN transferase [Neobacillus niacini]MDR6998477.1 thiamine biosynthesis lipoprotein [Neobacillus niacini]
MIAKQEDHNDLDTLTIEAMNTSFYIAVTNCKINNWKKVIQGWVRYVEQEWSRFRRGNELDHVNHLKIGEKLTLTSPLFDVLSWAETYRQRTDGFFSPYLLQQMEFHGYQQSFPFITDQLENTPIPSVVRLKDSPFEFSADESTIIRKGKGQVDLGGIGKGYAVQAAANWLKHIGEAAAGMVDGGGDITVWSNGCKEWRIGVAHPIHEDKEIFQYRLKNGSIATSNTIYRSWKQNETKKHHILNGKTGEPVESNIIQATVTTENCLNAEVAAKLCFMTEKPSIEKQLKMFTKNFSVLLVRQDGKIMM